MTRAQDIARVRSGGRRYRGRVLELRAAAGEAGLSRVGVVVPRHGHSAVDRNRVKRRLREVIRLEQIGTRRDAPRDFIVFALPGAYDVGHDALRVELLALCDRADR